MQEIFYTTKVQQQIIVLFISTNSPSMASREQDLNKFLAKVIIDTSLLVDNNFNIKEKTKRRFRDIINHLLDQYIIIKKLITNIYKAIDKTIKEFSTMKK